MRRLINRFLPSKQINEDVIFTFNKIDTIKPIKINELSLISPVKKTLLKMRKENSTLSIERSSKKMALVIPYRHREVHLKKFLPYIENYLEKQNIEYEIIVVEQDDTLPFNRAKLMNIGALNASKDVDYFVFHDVDLLPENIDYSYCNHSLKLFTFIKQEDGKYKEYKQTNFGGAILVPKEIFYNINGFSNNYWQWGKEDDDFFLRHLLKGYTPFYDSEGKFDSLPHPPSLTRDNNGNYSKSKLVLEENRKLRLKNKKEFSKLKRNIKDQNESGLNTIANYKINSIETNGNIMHIKVNLF